jgi:hypothetical protein
MDEGGASDYYEASTIDIASDINEERHKRQCSILGTFEAPVKLGS